jgi:hypothetical protein
VLHNKSNQTVFAALHEKDAEDPKSILGTAKWRQGLDPVSAFCDSRLFYMYLLCADLD